MVIHYYGLSAMLSLLFNKESSMSLLLLKYLHILGIVLLVGNILVSAWWKIMANRTKDATIISFAQRQVTLTDYFFTLPGAILIVISGDMLAFMLFENTWEITWVSLGRIAFGITGFIWLFILIPIQIRQAKLAREFVKTGSIPETYWKLCQRWNFFGTIAVILPLIVLAVMIWKPI